MSAMTPKEVKSFLAETYEQRIEVTIQKLIEMIVGIEKGTIKEGDVKDALHGTYTLFVDRYRPLIKVLADLLPAKIADEYKPIVLAVLSARKKLLGDKDLVKACKEMTEAQAKLRKTQYDAYVAASFSPAEAMQFVLAEAAKPSPLAMVTKSIFDSAAKSKPPRKKKADGSK